jgi:hypothetical protein
VKQPIKLSFSTTELLDLILANLPNKGSISELSATIEGVNNHAVRCATCRYMVPEDPIDRVHPTDEGIDFGRCRRYPPSASDGCPLVNVNESWCGEHRVNKEVDE